MEVFSVKSDNLSYWKYLVVTFVKLKDYVYFCHRFGSIA